MRSPGNLALDGIVHRVVVNVNGHSKNAHGHVCWHDKQDAINSIAIVVVEIVFRTSFDPCAIDLEEDWRQLVRALGDNDTLLVFPVIDLGILEEIPDEGLVVDDGDDKRGRSCVNDGIEAIVLEDLSWQIGVWLICEAIFDCADCNARVVETPEEVGVDQLRLHCRRSFLNVSQIGLT